MPLTLLEAVGQKEKNSSQPLAPPVLSLCDGKKVLSALEGLLSSGATVEDEKVSFLLRLLKAQTPELLASLAKYEVSPTPSGISKNQREMVKKQIAAYRLLSRNVPLSPATLSSMDGYTSSSMKYPLDLLVQSKLESRLRELQVLGPKLPKELTTCAEIELLQMKLLWKQKKLRNDIASDLRSVVALKATQEKEYFRKESTQDIPLEQNRQNRKNRKKHARYLTAVLSTYKAFREFYSASNQKMKRINRSMLTYHASKVRKEQQHKEKEEKDRLRALKENDEVAYIKLLEKTKNDRLTQLLNQTDEYLSQIGALVSQAKSSEEGNDKGKAVNQEAVDLNAMTEEEKKQFFEREEEESRQSQSTKTYYTIAHTIKEKIYKQPSNLVGGTLKRYQLKGLQWLVSLYNNNLNGVLADEMGLGKTIQTISLLTYLMEKKQCLGPFLIIVPLSVISNWEHELKKWAPSIINISYKGIPKVRKDLYQSVILNGKFNTVLTTFNFIMRDKRYLSKVHWNYIIVDEGHRMKNAESKFTMILSNHYRSRHRLLLTGTPLQNSIPELWSLLNFLLPTIFNSVENFENWFSAPFAAAGNCAELNEEENLLIIHRLHKVLRPFLLRRVKLEVEDQLPAKVEKVMRCSFSAMQRRLYDVMESKGTLPTEGKAHSQGLMNTLMQLRKVCNHPYLFSPNGEYIINEDLVRSSGKLVLLDQVLPKLKESGHRVLIFSQMTALMTILGYYFNYRGYKHLRLDGSTKSDDREEYMRQFNEKDSPFFIFMLSTRAGGLGLNLQTSDTVILFDSDWNPQIDLQAQDRAHRIGQKNEVRVLRFISINSIEEDILARANHKLDVDKKIIQAGMFNNNSSASQRREYLMNLLQREKDGDERISVPSRSEVNRMIARGEDEFDLFERMDLERDQRDIEVWKARGREGKPPPALMQLDELPEWLKEVEKEEEVVVEYGRGRRARGEVTYNDPISDANFKKMMLVDQPATNQWDEDAIFGDTREDKEDDDEEESSVLATEETESADFEPASFRKKRRVTVQATGDKEVQKLQKKLKTVLKKMAQETAEGGRKRNELFIRLPPKRFYPDYYQIISSPIDIKQIKTKVKEDAYVSTDAFMEDISLLFANARTYNMEGSQVHTDATILENICRTELAEDSSFEGIR